MLKKCLKCNYEWEARKESPKACPECKSRKWRIASILPILIAKLEDNKIITSVTTSLQQLEDETRFKDIKPIPDPERYNLWKGKNAWMLNQKIKYLNVDPVDGPSYQIPITEDGTQLENIGPAKIQEWLAFYNSLRIEDDWFKKKKSER